MRAEMETSASETEMQIRWQTVLCEHKTTGCGIIDENAILN